MSRLPPRPELEWSADGAPRSVAFGDVYFSRDGGLAETDAVFLVGCGLPGGWAGRRRFAILELGFGTGLNLLAAWRLWRATRSAGALLHYVTIEAAPMSAEDAARAHAAFPEVAALSARLRAHWPVQTYAPQHAWLDDDLALTVHHGEAEAILGGLRGRFDAFFLDGFAPSRNPTMWGDGIARRIAAIAAPNARLASYTVAGSVRRALSDAGFRVEKRPGFGAKRERLEAILETPVRQTHTLYPYNEAAPPKRIAVVGGGIAGAAMARAAKRRGADVVLYEAGATLGAKASGNPVGLVMPRLDRGLSPVQGFFVGAYLNAVRAYNEIGALDTCGVIERGRRDLVLDPPLPGEWLAPLNDTDVLHPRAGVVRPRAAIATWTRGAEVRLGSAASLAAIRAEADAVVIAAGAWLNAFTETAWLDLRRTAGQIEVAALDGAAPAHALVGESYAAPLAGELAFGATFARTDAHEAQASDAARAANVEALRALAPELAARVHGLRSRAAVRAAARDYLPIVGLAPDAPAWLTRQAGLAHGRPADISAPAPSHAGLYLFGGLGARGLTLAPLLAERLAAEIWGEPQILLSGALDLLNPARFLHRRVRKGLTKLDGHGADDNT